MGEEGRKNDQGKLRFDLIPVEAEVALAEVLTFGADKYGDTNWKNVPNAMQRYEAAMKRHIAAYKLGEMKDPETGCSHLAHAQACITFMVALERQNENSEDSRK
jgi:hypothetical protein